MKIKKLLVLAPIAVLSLTSCGTSKHYEVKEYKLTPNHARFDATNGLKILQLSDIHLSMNCDRQLQYKFLQKTIDLANAYAKKQGGKDKVDLITITGDVFIFGTREIVREFCEFMESQKIDWTLTFGNHDEQCYFPIDWLTGYLNDLSKKDGSYLLFKDIQDDDISGNANFYIDVPDKDGNAKERIYMIDSNRYKYTLSSFGYDNIHEDQIKWYKDCVKDGTNLKSLAFFHIPFEEYETYYKDAIGSKTKGEFINDDEGNVLDKKGEGISCSKIESKMFETMVDLGSTKATFVGHDHKNNFAIKTKDNNKNNMILSYGVKATDSVGADDNLIGGQVITVKGLCDLDDIKIHPITHKYSELEGK